MISFYIAFVDEMQKIAKEGAEMQPLTPEERRSAAKRYAQAKPGMGDGDGCSPGKTKSGYNFHTHRAGTGAYPSFDKIPIKKIRFVGTTA